MDPLQKALSNGIVKKRGKAKIPTVAGSPTGTSGSININATGLTTGTATFTVNPSTFTGYTYSPTARIKVLGREFDLPAGLAHACTFLPMIGYLGIGYYIHLKESGYTLSDLPGDLVAHLEALAAHHQRGERIKKVLDEDACA